MEFESKLIELETRVKSIEKDRKEMWDKLRRIENVQSCEKAELSNLNEEMKSMKATLGKINKSLESLSSHDLETHEELQAIKKWVIRIGAFLMICFIYIAIKDKETAKGILQLSSTLVPLS